MTEPQKLKAFTVTLAFDDGMMATMTLVAPNVEMATAMMGAQAGKTATGNLVNMACAEIPVEWLRFALRAVESGKGGGDVVSLVSDNLRPAPEPSPDNGPHTWRPIGVPPWGHTPTNGGAA